MQPKITIIIPIYKVEAFIKRCVTTLMEQTLHELEYIFVDDATPDNSVRLLEEVIAHYPERKEQINVVHHKENKGLPAARNTGLLLAKGEYIFHCDSDDYVEPTMLEDLYYAAKTADADVVWCDWFLTFAHNERYMVQPKYSSSEQALKGILHGQMKYNVWNKLVKRNLYTKNHILFPAGYSMGEDMTMIRLMACAERISYVHKAYYHYVKMNVDALTNNYTEKHLNDILYNSRETICFVEQRFGKHRMKKDIAAFKLNVKYPFLITDNRALYNIWISWFPEANFYIWSDKSMSIRNRFLQYAASKKWWLLLSLYYKCVYKLMYGFIYK